jgi:hypothetical protein
MAHALVIALKILGGLAAWIILDLAVVLLIKRFVKPLE